MSALASPGADLDSPIIQELQELQAKRNEYDEKHNEELAALNRKYQALYEPLYQSRAKLVKGGEGQPGVERFWLTVLQSSDATASHINEKDVDVLTYLVDIREDPILKEAEEEGAAPEDAGFQLTFEFKENPYFSETVLTKKYHMEEDDDVLDGAEGCPISWKPGKNVTVKVMKKKPKPGGRGGGRIVTKTEQVPSFFDFFAPPTVPEEGTQMDEEAIEELQSALEADFELGDHIRGNIVPHAVSWYTGEMQDEESDEEEEEDESEDDGGEDDEDDDSSEGDDSPPQKGRGKAQGPLAKGAPAGAKGAGATLPGPGGEKEECKQQ